MIFNVAPLSPVGDGPVCAAPDRKIEGGWTAFYAFLPRRNAEAWGALEHEGMALRMPARVRGRCGDSAMA
jgi:hypothetical protein